jgi:hypothetical protein
VVCVDIDDGVGAGYAAALIARGSERQRDQQSPDSPSWAEAVPRS